MGDLGLLAVSLLQNEQAKDWQGSPKEFGEIVAIAPNTAFSMGVTSATVSAVESYPPQFSRRLNQTEEREITLEAEPDQPLILPPWWSVPASDTTSSAAALEADRVPIGRPILPISQQSAERQPLTPAAIAPPERLSTSRIRPASGSQLFSQRLAALKAGKTYTRLSTESFETTWKQASFQPNYEDWVELLQREAKAMARGQGKNRLSVLVGDSLSQWFPAEWGRPQGFWLNQGISGDTTAGILRRLPAFAETRPDVIHLMAGINDLRRNRSPEETIANLSQIVQQLKATHPQAQIFVYSILPTRLQAIPMDRIQRINRALQAIAPQHGATYIDLHSRFSDGQGALKRDFTNDGLHLNWRGYVLWGWLMRQAGA